MAFLKLDELKNIDWKCVAVLGGALGAASVGYFLYNHHMKHPRKVVKDGIVLLNNSPLKYSNTPCNSPFCLALETFMRMAVIPYESDNGYQAGSKGKWPWIVYNGQEVEDSGFCMEFLTQEFNVQVDAHLTNKERAIAHMIQKLVDEHTYWSLIYYLYVDNWCETYSKIWKTLPFCPRMCVPSFKNKAIADLYSQGMGRHTREEIYQLAEKDLQALSDLLGDKSFFMGDKPCSADAAVFGLLSLFIWSFPSSPQGVLMKEKLVNLMSFCVRMRETYWSDWDNVVASPRC